MLPSWCGWLFRARDPPVPTPACAGVSPWLTIALHVAGELAKLLVLLALAGPARLAEYAVLTGHAPGHLKEVLHGDLPLLLADRDLLVALLLRLRVRAA